MEGHAPSNGQSISYLPFQEILRTSAGIDDEDDESLAWRKLETHIQALFPERIAEILPYLASLLVLEPGEAYLERVKYLDSEALGRQIYRAMRLYIRQLAHDRPLVLVFDDLHWMDGSSVGLVEHLLPLVREIPLLVCGLSRPDSERRAVRLHQIAEREYADCFTNIVLTPLSTGDSGRLVHNLLEIDGMPAQVRAMMVAKADGNPFYLEEIVRDLIDAGALVQDTDSGNWRATEQIEQVSVPDTIQGLLLGRIDRLDEDLKRVLRRAAVVGRTFLFRVLNAVLRDNRELDNHITRLQQVEIIRERQQTPELEYIFKHALAQEAAYESILLQERREMHARVGVAIETLFAEKIGEFYGLLAYHYSAAERWDRAQEYLLKAGDQAGRMAADSEALGHYERAMTIFSKIRGEEGDPLERAQLERKIGQALLRLGQYEQAKPYLERALALLGAPALPDSRRGTRLAILGAVLRQAGHSLLPRLFVRPMDAASELEVEEVFLATAALIHIETLYDELHPVNKTQKERPPLRSSSQTPDLIWCLFGF